MSTSGSPGPPSSVFHPNPTSHFTFNVEETVDLGSKHATAAPVDIPSNRQSPLPSQRHTNFTPPRSYMVASPVAVGMVRSQSASSLSTAMSVLVGEQLHSHVLTGCIRPPRPKSDSHRHELRQFAKDQTSKSVPNFDRCALESTIAQELRNMSDSFNLEFSGFRHGYDFARAPVRLYPSSYPGCARASGRGTSWQGVVRDFAPCQFDKLLQAAAATNRDVALNLNCSDSFKQ